MSVQAMGWVFENMPDTSAGAKLVLLSIANHCGADGKDAWPSLETLAKEARLSRRQAIRCVNELAASGHIVVHKGGGPTRQGGATNLYEIPGVVTGRHPVTRPEVVTSTTEPSDISGTEVVTPMSPEPRTNRPEPSTVIDSDFDRFWKTYPRKVGKRTARAAFRRAALRASLDQILGGAARYRDDRNRDEAFTAHPTTWLNRDGWADDPEPARSNGKPPPADYAAMAREMRELEAR